MKYKMCRMHGCSRYNIRSRSPLHESFHYCGGSIVPMEGYDGKPKAHATCVHVFSETETEKQMEKIYRSKGEAIGAAMKIVESAISAGMLCSISDDIGSHISVWSGNDIDDGSAMKERQFKYHELQAGYVYAVWNRDTKVYYKVFTGRTTGNGMPIFDPCLREQTNERSCVYEGYKPTGIKAE